MHAIIELLGADRYSAHAICLSNDPIVMTLFAAANLTTFISYIVIGLTLLIYADQIITVSDRGRLMYGLFIILCGLHHACQVLTLFAGVYGLELMVDMGMAAASVTTAIMTALELPRTSRSQLAE